MDMSMQVKQNIFVFNQTIKVLGASVNRCIQLKSVDGSLIIERAAVSQVNSLYVILGLFKKDFIFLTVCSKRLI